MYHGQGEADEEHTHADNERQVVEENHPLKQPQREVKHVLEPHQKAGDGKDDPGHDHDQPVHLFAGVETTLRWHGLALFSGKTRVKMELFLDDSLVSFYLLHVNRAPRDKVSRSTAHQGGAKGDAAHRLENLLPDVGKGNGHLGIIGQTVG
jgi:hypothetical protein